MNNLVQRRIPLTTDWQPLSAEPLIATVDISCPPMNAGLVYFQGDDGSEVPWIPGEWHQFFSVDLSAIRVRGSSGDAVTVIGGTW
jgi:hypothetical protein